MHTIYDYRQLCSIFVLQNSEKKRETNVNRDNSRIEWHSTFGVRNIQCGTLSAGHVRWHQFSSRQKQKKLNWKTTSKKTKKIKNFARSIHFSLFYSQLSVSSDRVVRNQNSVKHARLMTFWNLYFGTERKNIKMSLSFVATQAENRRKKKRKNHFKASKLVKTKTYSNSNPLFTLSSNKILKYCFLWSTKEYEVHKNSSFFCRSFLCFLLLLQTPFLPKKWHIDGIITIAGSRTVCALNA